ncbi:PREDICTED: uncharacterized protein LOC109329946 [Lupinus angustifolius]|uniref:uncharacterized protein LOC109329946 n=1 Tax=Lupinus angustifolius TaxID=3871 RepID=UPI00092F08D9|nr:PREDICTED: uncharacterized protein LOC109329946 [Lupinus angustifolius]
MGQNSGNFPANLPVLDGKNWNRWRVQMKALMGYQEVDEIVEQGFPSLVEGATEEQRKVYKESKKKDCKAMFLLHQCVDEAHFEKISGAENSKEAWKILEACNQGVEQLKKHVEKRYQFIVEKILRTLTPNFDHIVVAIEESKRLEEMKVEDLQGSLEAHEQRLMERAIERPVEQALQAHTGRRNSVSKNGFRGRGRSNFRGGYFKNSQQSQDRMDPDKNENAAKRGGFNQWKGGRRAVDRRKLKCFNFGKLGHFSNECKTSSSENRNRQHIEAHMVKEESEIEHDEQPLLLMMVTSQASKHNDEWYIDSGCSSHMTGHKDWLVNFDESRTSIVRFADNRVIQAKGTSDVLIKIKDGKERMESML